MMLTGRRGWIGVDIGARSVKLAQLVRKRGGVQLSAALVVQRRQPWSTNGQAPSAPQKSADEIIAGLSLCRQLRGSTSASAVPMAACEVQAISVSSAESPDCRTAITRELVSIYNGPPASFVFDYWPTAPEQNGSQDIHILSSPRGWASRIAGDHRAAGLGCKVLDGAPFALSRAIELTAPGASSAPQAVLDWGYSCATFCIVVQGRPLFVRRLKNCALGALIEAIRENLGLTIDEAHQLLIEYGAPDVAAKNSASRPARLTWDVAETALNDLVEELDRTISYLETHRFRLAPQAMWLFGGGAALPNVASYLQDSIGLTTRPWSYGGLQPQHSTAATPSPLLGQAIALSSLAWTNV